MPITTIIPIILITGLVQILKESLGLPSKYAQLAAFSFAIIFGILFTYSVSITESVVNILEYGLAAIGLWEVGGVGYSKMRGNTQDVATPPVAP